MEAHDTTCNLQNLQKSKFDRKDTENIAIIKIFIKFYRNILSKLCLQA